MTDKRADRLRQLIDERFNGKQIDFSMKTKISTSQIGQWLGGYRAMGEKSARNIERLCGIPVGWLDDNQSVAATTSNDWPLLGVSQAEWELASDVAKGTINAYARIVLDQDLRRLQEIRPTSNPTNPTPTLDGVKRSQWSNDKVNA